MATTAIGGLVGGVFGALGNVAEAVGQGTQSLASTAMQVLPDDIRGQAERRSRPSRWWKFPGGLRWASFRLLWVEVGAVRRRLWW